jgi:hypothetical protein
MARFFMLSQFFDFVLQKQLLALELQQFDVIARLMRAHFRKLLFQSFVAALEFDNMAFQGHAKPPVDSHALNGAGDA